MATKDWILVGTEVVVWYGFLCYLLYSIKNPVNIYQSALILLVLGYIASFCCPIIRHTEGFKKLFKK